MKIIIGWVLLTLGMVIIIFILWNSYLIFTAQNSIPEIFKISLEKTPIFQKEEETKEVKPLSLEEIQQKMFEGMKEVVGERIKETIPIEFIIKFFNLFAWSIFSGIAIFGGAKISEIGVKLLIK